MSEGLTRLEQGLELVDDADDFLAEVNTAAALDLLHVFEARDDLQHLFERAQSEQRHSTHRSMLDAQSQSQLPVCTRNGARTRR